MNHSPLIELKTKLDYDKIKADQIKQAIDYWIDKINNEIKLIHKQKSSCVSWETTIKPLLNLFNQLIKVYSVASHFNVVMDSDEIRKAFEYAMIEFQKLTDKVDQDKTIYKRLLTLLQKPKNLDKAKLRYLNLEIQKYEKNGVHLKPKKRKRLEKINQSLAKLSLNFEQNILDDANLFSLLIKKKHRLKGLSADLITNFRLEAKKHHKTGFMIRLSQPNMTAILQNAENRKLRKSIHKAWSIRAKSGKFDNHQNIDKILKLKKEKAVLLGFDDYCQFILSERMAKNYDTVNQLLQDIGKKARPKAMNEYNQLVCFAKESLGLKKVKAYDIGFVCQKLKVKTFGFDDQMLRDYFPVSKVLEGLFNVAFDLYQIQFKEVNYPVWHFKVKSFEIYQNNQLIGVLYADLYARDTKRSGAWMSDYQSYLEKKYHGHCQIPVAFINMNFMDSGNQENYLTFEDVLTFFHEAGHSLHHLLTNVGLMPISGINSVQWDAVELPSQLMENFCYNWHYLKKMTRHKQTNQPISFDLFSQIIAAKNQFSGLFLIRQLVLALFDLNIHHQNNFKHWQAILDKVKKQWMVFKPIGYDSLATSFSHIFAGGYDSGYYSYLWADILSSDIYGLFVEQSEVIKPKLNQSNGMDESYFAKTANPINGSHFLQSFLSKGALKDAADLFYDMRGRNPKTDFLFKSYGIH